MKTAHYELFTEFVVGGFIRKNSVLTETAWQLTINVLAAEAPMRT
jgi:hypothetical protein